MNSLASLLLFIILCNKYHEVIGEKGKCVMEGPCVASEKGGINCLSPRAPVPLTNPESVEHLRSLCPVLFEKSDNPAVCCFPKQVSEIMNNFGQAESLLARCPSCYENFRKIFCNFVCSPNQDEFVHPKETFVNQTTNLTVITSVDFIIGKSFVESMYGSCNNVKLSPTMKAVDMMCGEFSGGQCNAQRWVDFMGDPKAFSPFRINFLLTNDPIVMEGKTFNPAVEPTFKCSEKPYPDSEICSCLDCEETCELNNLVSQTKLPVQDPPSRIVNIDFMTLVTIIFGLVTCSLIILAYVIQLLSKPVTMKKRIAFSKTTESQMYLDKNTSNTDLSNGIRPSTKIHRHRSTWLELIGIKTERLLQNAFQRWGTFVAKNPLKVMIPSFLVSLALCCGIVKYKLTTDPVELWASPSSQARQDLNYFNTHFRPFYRVEQIILAPTNLNYFEANTTTPGKNSQNYTWGPAFERVFFREAYQLQRAVEKVVGIFTNKKGKPENVTLKDVCLQPLEPFKTECIIQSVFLFYDQKELNTTGDSEKYLERYKECINQDGKKACFGEYGGPLTPAQAAFGSYEVNGTQNLYHTAKALVITLPVLNNVDKADNEKALAWEEEFIRFMLNVNSTVMSVAFKGERSVEDELERTSNGDIPVVAASYAIMFVYIALALGDLDFSSFGAFLTHTKVSLGLAGVVIVLISVAASLGVFFYANVPATLIIIQVIPFLVLAVGVDNIFILVQAFQMDKRRTNEILEDQIGRVVGEVAPSMMLSSVSMACCFFIGALTDAPAVKIFAMYAGVSLVINFFLQMTCFLALFTFDSQREEGNRLDMLCCVKSKSKKRTSNPETFLYIFMKNVYTPMLLNKYVRIVVLLLFLGWLCSSLAVIDKIELGLDQELSMPSDSYMLKYFEYLNKYLTIGPPLYFVVTEGFNYSDKNAQNRICGMAGCDSNSLVAYSQGMQSLSNRTYIATAVNSWLDDYIDYVKGLTCCMINDQGTKCTDEEAKFDECLRCNPKAQRPTGEMFDNYLSFFLTDVPNENCPRAGRAQYRDSIEIKNRSGLSEIGATNFMSYHTVLKTSHDFYKALEWARAIADEMTLAIRGNDTQVTARVFPYSLVHVFFEQYLDIWTETLKSLGYALVAIFVVVFLVMGCDVFSAFVVVLTITMIIVNLMGFMYWWNIQLNAVSLVNLVVSIGISVEFCSHLTRCFTLSPEPTRLLRAHEALVKMGSSILSGITLTDCGILALAFAQSKIFEIFYFRMFLGIIVFGTLHSLVFLPVFLSLCGPPVNKKRMFQHQRLTNTQSLEATSNL